MTQEGAKPARRRAQFNTLLLLFARRQGDFFGFFQPLAEEIGPAKDRKSVV